jgi:TonB-linked SusC/RagA family outer membrane protein
MQKKTKNNFRQMGLLLIMFSFSFLGFAQQNIRGKVVDTDGFALPGATVVVIGTNVGTITDVDGNYALSAASNAELKFSFIGMANLIEKVNGRTTINVVLKSDAINLNEIVAVGYGAMRKVDITGAVSSIKGDQLSGLGVFSAAQALQGKMSGVIVQNNGDAGANAKIRIRGVNTIGNNDPLIVIDGITNGGSINDIHPSDIESINVLKDASATAIFGSRASGGVILITTKGGKYGEQKMQLSLDASYGVATVTKRLDMVNSADLVSMIDEARTNENIMNRTRHKMYDEIWPGDDWGRQDITNWQDLLFRNAIVQDYSISAQGGSKQGIYSFSASYREQEGTIIGNFAKRLTLRANVETKVLKDKLKIGSTMSFTSKESQGSSQGDIWSAALFGVALMPGNIPAYNEQGKAYQETDPQKLAYFTPGGLYQNNAVIWNDYSNPQNNFTSILYADAEIFKSLKFKTTVGQNYGSNFFRDYKIASENPEGGDSKLNVSSSYSKSVTWDNVLTFDKKINDLSINAMVGTSALISNNNGLSAGRVQFPDGDIKELRYLNFGAPLSQTNSESASSYRLASYFGRINLGYKDKYLLTATTRRDGSSRFHEDVRWGIFPSASLGWRISEESFMKSINWFDDLKLRASWGQVGNQNVGGNYAYISSVRSGYAITWGVGSTDYPLGTESTPNVGKAIWQRGNENVTWETLTTKNLGLDFAIKEFSGSFELYRNNTTDVLLPAQIPDIAGYYPGTSQRVNSGEIQTQGFDFNLNYAKSINKFNFNVGVNLTYSDNEILSLAKNDFVSSGWSQNYKSIMGNISRSYVGDPIGSFYGYKATGIFNTQEEVDAANQKARDIAKANNPALTDAALKGIYYIHAKTAPGDRIFEDVDGDGRITAKDEMNLGCGNPKFQFGLNLSADYKGFDITANFSGAAGVQVYAMFQPALSLPGRFGSLSSIKDHWTPENQTTNFPRYTMSDPNGNGRASNIWVHDASYVRLQNLVLGYSLPRNLVTKLGLSNLRVFASVQNVFTITEYPFLEPEVISNEVGRSTGSVDLSAGVDVGSSPLPRTAMFGLNIKF